MNPKLLALPCLGVALAALRWVTQGSGNVWTDLNKRLYVPDPDLGWRVIEHGPLWLGLDALALCLGILGTVALMWWGARTRPALGRNAARLSVALGVLSLAPAGLAFASGAAPAGARDQPPEGLREVPEGVSGGLEGMPAGTWMLSKTVDPGISHVVAVIDAGGEAFEGRFETITHAQLRGDPSDLRQPLTLEVSIDPAGLDTGIDGRSSHGRKLLMVETHAAITFRLAQLTGAENREAGKAGFAGQGEVDFMGDTLPVKISGEIAALDGDARARLGIEANAAFRAQAEFELPISETKLAPKAGDFGADTFPIRASLIFVPSP